MRRWPSDGVAPISHTLDTTGLLARGVEDCRLVDAVLTKRLDESSNDTANLRDVKFAYAPRQYLIDVDDQTDSLFRESLRKLKEAGAKLVEIDLGEDFLAVANRTTWPIFFHETLFAVREFLAINEVPVSFEQNSEGLPLGLELDAATGQDRHLLALARWVEQVIGSVNEPTLF